MRTLLAAFGGGVCLTQGVIDWSKKHRLDEIDGDYFGFAKNACPSLLSVVRQLFKNMSTPNYGQHSLPTIQ